jgi:hypothetical protein
LEVVDDTGVDWGLLAPIVIIPLTGPTCPIP